jgi:hypothetical protein
VNTTDSSTTRLAEYISGLLPWAHGHQLKAITTFVHAILDRQTGCQAELARGLGNQEAACKRLSRLLHNERLAPQALAEAVLGQALRQLRTRGKVRLAIDWTSEANQHLLVVSLIVGRRAVPIYWRAYDQSVLKGRMQRYELAVVRRALERLLRVVASHRVSVTADRGFADVALFGLLDSLQVAFVIRVKGSTKVYYQGQWQKLNRLRFAGNTRRRSLGRLSYCERTPQRWWATMSRARDRKGNWGIWYLVSNRGHRAGAATAEYSHRFGCEEGFRDVKWWLGFKQAHIKTIKAWSRLFALFAMALLVTVCLGSKLLLGGGTRAKELLRRVTSRRCGRCELSVVSAMLSLLHEDKSLLAALSNRTKLLLEATLANVS